MLAILFGCFESLDEVYKNRHLKIYKFEGHVPGLVGKAYDTFLNLDFC